ncbi:hypothetical protein EC973_005667 [Apophysomyces ossiformis]|uniref:Uncharacterized protein n=1 Tax=Apophysomyces ossiformis TaxID=679940 RepID=A0A8H7BK46_9FUNG|nr:hypothetical protein EC973_005667 [Apophysomyces ossiformis]
MSGQKTTFFLLSALSSSDPDQIAHLEALVTQLSERVTTFKAVLQENTELRQYIIELETHLTTINFSSTATSAPVQPRTDSSPPWASSQASSWAKVAVHPPKNSVSTHYKAAATHSFQPITGPQGFTYIYLHYSQKIDHSEIHKQLQKLKIDTSCLLNITFPAHSIVGLLFYL